MGLAAGDAAARLRQARHHGVLPLSGRGAERRRRAIRGSVGCPRFRRRRTAVVVLARHVQHGEARPHAAARHAPAAVHAERARGPAAPGAAGRSDRARPQADDSHFAAGPCRPACAPLRGVALRSSGLQNARRPMHVAQRQAWHVSIHRSCRGRVGSIAAYGLRQGRRAETAMIHALLTAVVAAAGWSTPQVLSNGDIALGPELSMAPSGAAIAVWDRESGPDCAQVPASLTCAHIVEFSQRPSPLGWDYPREVARPGIGARPQVAVNDAGRAAIIWVHDIGRDRVVQATYRTGVNEPFPNPNDLSAAVLEVRDHHVGLDAVGNAAVVWAERHSTDFDVAAEIRSAASGTWGAPVVLSTGYVRAGPSLAVTPGGDAFAVWVEGSAVLAAHGNLAGGTWETPITLSQNAGVGASVAVNAAGDAVAVWTLGDRPGIGAAARPAGGSWGSAVLMNDSSPLNGVTAPSVALAADGTAVAVWVGGGR